MDSNFDQLFFDRMHIDNYAQALAEYSPKDLKSPFKPIVPLLSVLKDRYDILEGIMDGLGMDKACEHHLEYTVEPRQGNGKASYTDLMLRYKDSSLALEAKWTEPRYETVTQWLLKVGESPNSHLVIQGWLKQLQKQATIPLVEENFPDAVYQMVYHAAAACYQSARPRLAYVLFTPDPTGTSSTVDQYLADLRYFHGLLGDPENFKFHVIQIGLAPTPAFAAISELPKGLVATANAVRASLKAEPLFEFGEVKILPIV